MKTALTVFLLSCGIAVCVGQNDSQVIPKVRTDARNQPLWTALREDDGLHKAAKLKGGQYVLNTRFESYIQANTLAELLDESDLVLRAHVLSNSCKLNPHGNSIRTDYQVVVDSVMFGKEKGPAFTVSLPGGVVRFDDGSVAHQIVSDYPRMKNGATVVLFLRKSKAGAYVPSIGPYGIFELSNGVVHPFALRGSQLVSTYNDMPEPAFFGALSAIIEDHQKRKGS